MKAWRYVKRFLALIGTAYSQVTTPKPIGPVPGSGVTLRTTFHTPKVMLSAHAVHAWFEHVGSTIIPFERMRPLGATEHIPAVANLAYEIIVKQSLNDEMNGWEHAVAVFRHHIRVTRCAIAPEQLLTYQIAEGWEPLCHFFDAPVLDTPFPHSNGRRSFLVRATSISDN